MATLPNPDETQRVSPNAKSSVSSYNPVIDSQASVQLGNTISTIANQEIERIDTLKAQDAETELMRAELDLGEQYKAVKGGDVLKPEFHKGFKDRYNDAAKQIESKLSTQQQKARFQEIMKRRSVGFDAGRITYAMGESERFEKDQHNARVQVLTDTAAAQYANPEVIAATAMQLEDEIVKWGKRQGMSDPNIAQAFAKETKGNFYAALIDKALTDNDTSTANSLYAASKGLLSAEQSRSFSNQLKVGNDFKEGQTLAVKAQQMVAEGKSLAEVELFVATASTPGAYTAAQTIFGNLQQANTKAQAEAFGSVLEMYHTSGSNSVAKAKVLGSREYAKLDPAQRVKVIDYLEADVQQDKTQARADIQFGWAAENQAETRANRKEANAEKALNRKYKSPEAMAKFNSSFKNLENVSVQELYALTTDIGITNVNHLIAAKKNIEAGNKPLELDKALLEAAMPPELKKDTKEANVDAYNGFVKSALMEWQANNPGKKPTLEEQKAIARSANSEYTVPGRFGGFFGDNTYKAYEPVPEKRKAEATEKRAIISAAAAKGRTLTPAQVDEIYKRSLTQE
jgi:hypothetical protein